MNQKSADLFLVCCEAWKKADMDVIELYTDWDVNKKTGIILGVLNEEAFLENEEWPLHIDQQAFYGEVEEMSIKGQKKPGSTEVYWLNDRMILIKRAEILVQIEKELIKSGYVEELKMSKRPLEYRLFAQSRLEQIIGRKITEVFVDWNFEEDKAFAVLILAA